MSAQALEHSTQDSAAQNVTAESLKQIITVAHAPKTAVESAKQIITIVTGMTITNSILVLLTGGAYGAIYALNELPSSGIFFCIFLIVNCIRFYHGTMKSVNIEYYEIYLSDKSNGRWLLIDIIALFIQTLFFSLMSFYVNDYYQFVIIFLIILVFDISWSFAKFLYLRLVIAKRISPNDRIHRPSLYMKWSINNLMHVVGILFFLLDGGSYGLILYFILCSNTIVDYRINWSYYVPNRGMDKKRKAENNEKGK